MKRFLPLVILLLGAAYLLSTLRPEKNSTQFDLTGFGEVPVLVNGRIKPLDTVARTSLLTLQGRQRVSSPETGTLVDSPAEWLATVFFNPTKADDLPTIKIESPEVLTLLGLEEKDTRIDYDSAVKKTFAVLGFLPSSKSRFSYNQLKAKLPELDRQGRLAEPVEAQLRTPFQKQVITVRNRVILYLQLRLAVQMPESTSFLTELELFERALPAGVAAVLARQKNEAHDENALKVMKEMADRFAYMEQLGHLRLVPPAAGDTDPTHWELTGTKLLESFGTGKIDPTVMNYARLGEAWRKGDTATFNKIVGTLHDEITPRYPEAMRKSDIESRFNAAGPFYSSMTLYVWAFLLAIVSWLKWPQQLGRAAMWLLALAFATTTAGFIARMWIGGYAPVTNLYSSALGVAWGAVLLCLVLEYHFKNAIGSAAGGLIGFLALIIAHYLSLTTTDTMEMMRAVLDSNFWLATHVVIITLGYSATFLAGFLAIIYVILGVFTRKLTEVPTATEAILYGIKSPVVGATAAMGALTKSTMGDSLTRMVYGIVCFATLFSLVGTVLGGIWADQSWGRFWGWDPKENGALLIVIWNAVILHARWGGLVKQRGLMGLAIFGNIVTAWSWFGTNMLGVGLHSYGFMDEAFKVLLFFVLSQGLLIGFSVINPSVWLSVSPETAAQRKATRLTAITLSVACLGIFWAVNSLLIVWCMSLLFCFAVFVALTYIDSTKTAAEPAQEAS